MKSIGFILTIDVRCQSHWEMPCVCVCERERNVNIFTLVNKYSDSEKLISFSNNFSNSHSNDLKF